MFTGSFGAASNRAAWSFSIELTDPDNDNEPVDLTGATIEIAISEKQAELPLISGSTTDGKVVVASPATEGIAEITFPRSDMQRLDAGQYDVGIVVTLASSDPVQLAKGNLAVIHGVVSKA